MDWRYLFLSFEGRISRKYFWLGNIGMGIALILIININLWLNETLGLALIIVAYLISLYPTAALMVKRLHDRNRTGWWAALVMGLGIAFNILQFAGLAGQPEQPNMLDVVVFVASAIVTIWLVIELGFLKGTQGPNRFGPDPLGATQADAAL